MLLSFFFFNFTPTDSLLENAKTLKSFLGIGSQTAAKRAGYEKNYSLR